MVPGKRAHAGVVSQSSVRYAALAVVAGASAVSSIAGWAADFRSTVDAATILYDAPSAKAKPMFILGRDTPLEVIVPVEAWIKVRDMAGTIGWVERRAVSDRRSLVVRVAQAEVRTEADDAAPLVFRAERGVLLELAEPAIGATTTVTPGWVKVRHRDGQAGFVRIASVFGL